MRNCYRKLAACFASLLLLSLFSFPALQAQTPFQKGWDAGNDREDGYGIDAAGADFVVSGTIETPGTPSDILLMKVSNSGVASNQVRISQSGTAEAEWARDVLAQPSGAYVIAGGHRSSANIDQAMLTQTDASGNVQWCANYTNANLGRSFNAVSTSGPGNYCAVGWTDNLLTSGADRDALLVIASNNTGAYQSGNSFGGVRDEVFYDVTELSNGNLLAVGYTESFGAVGKAMYLVMADSVGNKVWSRVLDGPFDDIAYAAVEDAFGITIVGQTASFNLLNRADPSLARFQLNGQFLSLNVYEGANFENSARDVAYIPNDGYIISGRSLGVDSIAFMLRINANFGVSWMQQYAGISLNHVVQSGTHFMGVGSHQPVGATRKDVYVVQADAMGNTGSTCLPVSLTPTSSVQLPTPTLPADTIVAAGLSSTLNCASTPLTQTNYDACSFVGLKDGMPGQVNVHPNPTADFLKVDYAFDGLHTVHIDLLDLQGRSVLRMETAPLAQGVSTLDLSTLPAGTYLMRLRAGETTWNRKVVRQ